MTRIRVEGLTISLDGYAAGPQQDLRNPLGVGGTDLHQWLLPTRTVQQTLFGAEGGTTGIDDDFAARGFQNVGAWILGRNMFGPVRGPWPDMHWKGWWGDNPPYHVPTFILTHHARAPIEMEGGTTFHFVTGGMHEALERARDAAKDKDVRIGGGPNTIQQYLRAGLIDELHIAIAPVLLGGGERLFEGTDLRALGYACVQFVASEKATHVVLRRLDNNPAMHPPTPYLRETETPTRAEVDALPGLTLLEFGTDWCGHCRAAQPALAQVLPLHAQWRHVKVEDGPGRPLGRSYRVKLWPTLVLLRDGQEVARLVRPTQAADIAAALVRA